MQRDISRGIRFWHINFGIGSAHVHLHPPNVVHVHVFGGCLSMKVPSVYMYRYLLLLIPNLRDITISLPAQAIMYMYVHVHVVIDYHYLLQL